MESDLLRLSQPSLGWMSDIHQGSEHNLVFLYKILNSFQQCCGSEWPQSRNDLEERESEDRLCFEYGCSLKGLTTMYEYGCSLKGCNYHVMNTVAH